MRFRLSSYFLVCGVILSASLLLENFVFGVAYLLAIIPLFVFVLLFRKSESRVSTPIIIAVFSIFAFYFIRPVFIGFYPDRFGFISLGFPSTDIYSLSMLYLGVFSTAFLFGLCCTLLLGSKKKQRSLFFYRDGVIFKLRYLFLFFLVLTVFFWALLVLFFDVGIKNKYSALEVIKFILPIGLIIPSALGCLMLAIQRPTFLLEKLSVGIILVAMLFLTLISGSKSGVFILFLYSLIIIFLVCGDLRAHLFRVSVLVCVCVSLLLGSVVLANLIKYRGVASLFNPDEWFSGNLEFLLFTIDKVTFRLSGYDGMVATLMEHPAGLEDSLQWGGIVGRVLERLIPGYGGEGMSIGKSVGIYYGGKLPDEEYSGALGLFGTLYYMHGLVGGMLLAAAIGGFFGFCFRVVSNFSIGFVEKAILILILCYQMARWLSSGNFDSLIQEFIITMTHAIFYYSILRVVLFLSPKKKKGNDDACSSDVRTCVNE